MRRLGAAVAVAAAVVVGSAAPAAAHAELKATEPPATAVLDEGPGRLLLSFTEDVEVSFGAVRVYGQDGRRLAVDGARHPDGRGDAVEVGLPELEPGAYVVTWRVTSADSHPVHGAFTFRVGRAGEAGQTDALVRRLLAAEGGSTAVGAVYGLVRFAAFAGLVVLVGGAAFVLALWPAGAGDRRARRLLAGAWLVAVAAAASGVALQGAYAAGLPLGDAFRWSVVDGVLDTRFGKAGLARLVLLAVAGPLLVLATRSGLPSVAPRPSRPPAGRTATVPLLAALAAVLATPGLAGHPGTDHPAALAVLVDATHLAAVALWLGGLTVLAVALLPGGDPVALDRAVPRYSRLAFVAVVAILATGSFQAWRQAGSVDAVTGTTYGRLLLTKVALFAALVGLGALSRSWVRQRYGTGRAVAPGALTAPAAASSGPGAMAAVPALSALRRSVAAEAVLAAAVLAVTALLVNAVPARTALARPFSTELRTPSLLIDVTVDPAKAGPVDVHVYTLSPAGAVTDVEELTASLSQPERRIARLEVPLRRAGPGHFAAYAFDVPIPGPWLLEVVARTSDVDQSRARATVEIR